jgi:putative membrane protein
MSSEERSRLHPASVLFLFLGHARGFLLPVIAIIVFSETPDWEIWGLLILIPITLFEVWHYFTLRYWITGDDLIVKQGIIIREERHIPLERIQAIDSTQNLLQRIFGVVEVRVETAGSNKPEAHLRVLSLEARDRLRKQVFQAAENKQAGDDEVEPALDPTPAEELLRVTPFELTLLGLNPWRGVAILLVGFTLGQQLHLFNDSVLGEAWDFLSVMADQVRERGFWLAVLVEFAFVFLMLLVVLGLSIGSVWLSLYGFSLSRKEDEFVTECGLLTRHATTIKKARVQFISVQGPLFMRLFDRRLVMVRTAGSKADSEHAGTTRKWLTPVIAEARVEGLVRMFLPGFQLAGVAWNALVGRAKLRMIFKSGLIVTLLHTPFFWLPELSLVWPITWPLGVVGFGWLAHKRHQNLRWTLTDEALLIRDGFLHQRLAIVPLHRIQALALRASPMDRRHGMKRLYVDTAGANVLHHAEIPYLMADVADELVTRLSATAEASLNQAASESESIKRNNADDSWPENTDRSPAFES